MGKAVYYKTTDGRILCPYCLREFHGGAEGDKDLFVFLGTLPVDEYIVVDQKKLKWKFFLQRAHNMVQYLKRSKGKLFTIRGIEDLKKIVIRRTK